MKKATLILLAAALALLAFGGLSALAEAGEETDEWTVLFYFCGSDLESKYGYATGNLKELAQVHYPDNYYALGLKGRGLPVPEDLMKKPGKVNVLIETGGSSQWHTEEGDEPMGMNIDPTALQRWSYNTGSMIDIIQRDMGEGEPNEDAPILGYELLETLPLQSMADPETLADFIRWGVETRPAKKYALVLWDHGDGARSGLFIDELFDKDEMYLYELKQALADGGVHFDAIIIDACLMANIETAWNVKDYGDWLVASEEIVPGKGTAVGEWLNQLMCYPECGGEWLCRTVCDATSIKYADEESDEARSTLTWSVTDLSKVDALVEAGRRFFQDMVDALRNDPAQATFYMRFFSEAAEYGDGQQHMRDFGSVLYNRDLAELGNRITRNAAMQALSDAVVYCVRGSGRSEARGLTLCYPAGFTDEQLDTYAMNFPMPRYLAFIDAASDWSAPDWVYENVERLPEIDDIEALKVRLKKILCDDGMPGLMCEAGNSTLNTGKVNYTLYRFNSETGETVRLGKTDCILGAAEDADFNLIWRASDPMHWPSVEGQLICIDLVQSDYYAKLYNVPVMMNSQPSLLRMGRYANYAEDEAERINEYEVYGVWEGYEENSALLNRSVKPLSDIVGQEYQFLYPIDGTGKVTSVLYESSAPLTMYRALDVEEIPLPAGTYYLEYEVEDVFMRKTVIDRVELQWDGENMTFPEAEAWENGDWFDLSTLRQGK